MAFRTVFLYECRQGNHVRIELEGEWTPHLLKAFRMQLGLMQEALEECPVIEPEALSVLAGP